MKSILPPARRALALAGVLCAVSFTLGVLSGCKKSGSGSVATDPKLFQSASAEAKALWEEALAARQTNGVVEAYIKFRLLRSHGDLSPDQITAVDGQCKRINEELGAAAAKGDANAQQALVDIRNASRMRAR